jgi:hypothetical protein
MWSSGNRLRYSSLGFEREKVRTTKITTSKTKKNIEKFGDDHYIENGFLVDHNIENHCLFSSSLLRKSERRKECEKNIESHSFV